jgi:ABC-type sugar transport system ATPase subunit
VSFEVASGEILALTGLVGSGAHAVTKALGGAAPVAEGEVRVDGHAIPSRRPDRLMAHGCAYLPADRQRTGIAPLLSVRENLFLVRNRRAGDTFLRRPRRERARAVELVDRVRVKVAAATSQQAVEAPISTLSGGNQQKVLVGRAVRGAPRVLILEDPTAGVDVGARADLLLLLLGLADAGTAILLASVDYDEIGQVADRVIVFADGRVVADLSRGRITEEELARASFGYAPEVEDHRAHAQ